MAIAGPGVLGEPSTATSAPPFRYSMYGLRVRSDVRLPLTPMPGADEAPVAWAFRRAEPGQPAPEPDGPLVAEERCEAACHGGNVVTRVYRGPGGAWFWIDSIGTYHVRPGAGRVDVYPQAGADERALGLALAGQVSVFLLHRLGRPTLHASAVVTGHGAMAFFGPKGQGKSTMAACFLRRGATLLTDDILPLRLLDNAVCGAPGLPLMKVWRATAERTLELSEELPNLTANLEKKLLAPCGRYRFAETPARLRALYVLDRYDPLATGHTDVAIRPMSGREGLTAVLAQISRGAFLHSAEAACLLPLYARLVAQAPVRVLSYPHGFEHQAAVHARILADLEAP